MYRKISKILLSICFILLLVTSCLSVNLKGSDKIAKSIKKNIHLGSVNYNYNRAYIDNLKDKRKQIKINNENSSKTKEALIRDFNNTKKTLIQIYNENKTIRTAVGKLFIKIKEFEMKILQTDNGVKTKINYPSFIVL